MILETPQRRRPVIGLTALIDVVFILIVFFMLVSSFEQLRNVPLLGSASALQGGNADRVVLVLLPSGDLEVIGRTQTVEDAIAWATEEDLPVVISVGANVPVQLGLATLEELQARGLSSVMLTPGETD
ncbi:MAG: biopolymer transporter ExbD [Pseudomonadota bacterium]